MILYVDTSALVPLLVDEPSSARCGEIWDSADTITSTRLAYVEAAAALAQAARLGRVARRELRVARTTLDDLWTLVNVIEIDADLMTSAADLAIVHDLRGYDATHCAAAITANDIDVVAATGDQLLLAAWRTEGVATCDTNRF